MIPDVVSEGVTFDAVLLDPAGSEVIPAETDTRTCLTRRIGLNIAIVSAAMDTVRESHLAIALAQQGGIGIVHRNMTIDGQAEEVDRVKRSESGMIVDPITIGPDEPISAAQALMTRYRISGVPVTKNGVLVGILTDRDLRFENRFDLPLSEVMTKENLVTVSVGTKVDEGAKELISLGVEGIKVGIGPGSICTTRVVSGAGVPQIRAISECSRATREGGVPLIADGGIKYSGDITKAIAAGADCVMIGSLLAGTDESPGETILFQGRTFKTYRGMGSMGAMAQGSSDRYSQEAGGKLVPEGIEGRVAAKGPLSDLVYQLVGGLRSGMGYCGAHDIPVFQNKARFLRVSPAGLRESHVHDVIITKEAPNYRVE